jgi:predicted nuclease with TOPRIM domain
MTGTIPRLIQDYGISLGGLPNSEQTSNLQVDWSPSFAKDLKRDEELRRLGEQVARLASENGRLEGMIKEMSEMMSNLLLRFSELSTSARASNPAVIIEEMDSHANRRTIRFQEWHRTSEIEELMKNQMRY